MKQLVSVSLVIVAAGVVNADNPRIQVAPAALDRMDANEDAYKTARSSVADFDRKTKPILAADPRAAELVKQINEIIKTSRDRAARRKALEALGPQVAALRTDTLRKAGLDLKVVDQKVESASKNLSLPRLKLLPLPADGTLKTVNVTSFPKTFSYKNDCKDKADTWDFDATKLNVYAQSAIADNDCGKIRAGRTADVPVPAGATSVKIVVSAKVDLNATAMSFGAYGSARSYFAIRAVSANGALSELKVTKEIIAKNVFVNPIPVTYHSFDDTVQEGDEASTVTLALPANVGSTIEVGMVVGGNVDADLQGFGMIDNDLTPKTMKVMFYK